MMLFMLIAIIGIVVAIRVLGPAVTGRQLPGSSTRSEDTRLGEQAERIALLEEELRRVRDQADFTERLLAERGSSKPGDELEP